VKVSGGLLLLYGIGTVIGPTISGPVMSALGPHSLFLVTGFAHVAIVIYAMIRSRIRKSIPVEGRETFTATAGHLTTPESLTLNPRAAPLPDHDVTAEEASPGAAI
jgi:hypothetical protein